MACPWSAFFRTFATSNLFDPTSLPSHAQVVYQTLLASFVDDIDAEKRSELQAAAAKARERAVMANPPPPPPPQQQEKRAAPRFDELLPVLGWPRSTTAVTNADVDQFLSGAVSFVKEHGAELLKKANRKAYDARACAAFYLFRDDEVLAHRPLSDGQRMVSYNDKTYYDTGWQIDKVGSCSVCLATVCVVTMSASSLTTAVFCRVVAGASAPVRHVRRVVGHGRGRAGAGAAGEARRGPGVAAAAVPPGPRRERRRRRARLGAAGTRARLSRTRES